MQGTYLREAIQGSIEALSTSYEDETWDPRGNIHPSSIKEFKIENNV